MDFAKLYAEKVETDGFVPVGDPLRVNLDGPFEREARTAELALVRAEKLARTRVTLRTAVKFIESRVQRSSLVGEQWYRDAKLLLGARGDPDDGCGRCGGRGRITADKGDHEDCPECMR